VFEPLETDEYASDVHRWWHLSGPSPELIRTLDAGWLGGRGRVLDLGCGLGSDLAYLVAAGFTALGVDRSPVAVRRAAALHPDVRFLQADVLRLPFDGGAFGLLLDRGCFHYLPVADRTAYAVETARLLCAGGRLFLRSCLYSAGARNDITEDDLRDVFAGWRWLSVTREDLVSDTRTMPALIVLLERPA
jgi:SAM-dependent methyltransferase